MKCAKLYVKKQYEGGHLDSEWVIFMLDSDVENGPRDLLGIEDDGTTLTLSFKHDRGVYYARGRFHQLGVYSYKLDRIGKLKEANRKLFQMHHMTKNNTGKELNSIVVQPVNPFNRIDETELWEKMDDLNGLYSVRVKNDGRHAVLSYATDYSMYYTVGYFENDTFYDVQVKKPDLKQRCGFGKKVAEKCLANY